MLGDSAVLGGGAGGGSSGDAAAVLAATAVSAAGGNPRDGAQAADAAAGGGVGSNSGGEEDIRRGEEAGDRSFGGNRWPRQETLALLKIRSEMDEAFRDASVKGPLWEEVSGKLAELGYHRSAKKCKEKFENVYKYHKRTKEGRTGKSEGKTYRFFDQLEALDQNHPSIQSSSAQSRQQRALSPAPVSVAPAPAPPSTVAMPRPVVTVPSTTTPPMSMPQAIVTQPLNFTNPSYPSTNPMNFPPLVPNPTSNPPQTTIPPSYRSISTDFLSNSSSHSTSSDETLEGRRKRKRKWKEFFERLMKEVVEKQEDLQKRFLEAIEQRERERVVREEAWRMQEIARINAEKEILAQERSRAAAKDAAVMAFLQKIAEQQNLGQALNNINVPVPQPQPLQPQLQPTPTQATIPAPALVSEQQPSPAAPPQAQPQPAPPMTVLPSVAPPPQQVATNMEITKTDHNGENNNFVASSSSRWPKVEVEALIKLRTDMDAKYQESVPKGPLWEEISAAMRKLGYNRNAKRCKEKWENINKYFKKVKESNKKRPEDSKTCPYFYQLAAIYREKNKHERPEGMMTTPLMVRPEQQWPPQQQARPGQDATMEKADNEARDGNHEAEDDYEDDDKYGDEDDEDDEGSGKYEIVASKPAPPVSAAQQ